MQAMSRATLIVASVLLPFGACGDAGESPGAGGDEPSAANDTMSGGADRGILVEGFSGPESVVHDTEDDVYLVSNVNGTPAASDGNGFISRVSPEGEILALHWIDGASDGVTLNSPLGIALLGDTLVVADIDVVRLFDRDSGVPIGAWPVDGAEFLNGVAVGSDGTVYVSDTGMGAGAGDSGDSGSSAIHAFSPDGGHRTLDTGELTGINGLAASDGRLYGVTFGTGKIFMIQNGRLSELPELPGLRLDGIVALDDGRLLISDFDTETVYLLRENGSVSAVVSNVASPADIGVDRRRGRVLIPGLTTDRVLLAPLPG